MYNTLLSTHYFIQHQDKVLLAEIAIRFLSQRNWCSLSSFQTSISTFCNGEEVRCENLPVLFPSTEPPQALCLSAHMPLPVWGGADGTLHAKCAVTSDSSECWPAAWLYLGQLQCTPNGHRFDNIWTRCPSLQAKEKEKAGLMTACRNYSEHIGIPERNMSGSWDRERI